MKKIVMLLSLLIIVSFLCADYLTPKRTAMTGFTSTWTDVNITEGAPTTNQYLILRLGSSTTTPTLNFDAYSTKTIKFKARTYGGVSPTNNTINVSISTDNGSNWTLLTTRIPLNTTLTLVDSIMISSYTGTTGKIMFSTPNATSSIGVGIDDIEILGYSDGNNPPSTPVSSAATGITSTGFTANWGAVGTATSYRLDVSTSNAFSTFVTGYNNLTVSSNSQAVTGLSAGSTYYYRVKAANSYGESGYSDFITVITTALVMPDVPVAINAGYITPNSFTANWNSSANATSYEVDVSTVNNFSSFVTNYQAATTTFTSLSIQELTESTPYFYRVRGVNSNGISSNSNIISVTTSPLAVSATDLIISEYVEGSGFNKYLEIYNGTENSISLSDYKVELYTNGASAVSSTYTLSGTLDTGSTLVLAHTGAVVYTGTVVVPSPNVCNFSGDDALALRKISTNSYIDIIGTIGRRPVPAWTSGDLSTINKTLRRKSSVVNGMTVNPPDTIFTTLATEWDVYPIDTVSDLGHHVMDGIYIFDNPSNFIVNSSTVSSITLGWTPNYTNSVLLAYNTTNTFGTPTGTYTDGASIAGGGTVILSGNASTFTHNGLNPSTTYYYKIWSYSNGSYSSGSGIQGSTLGSLPQTPVATAGTSITSLGFTANWNTVSNADSYIFDLSLNSAFSSYVSGYQNAEVTANNLIISGLTANTSYYYRVKAINIYGESIYSNIITVTTSQTSGTESLTLLIPNNNELLMQQSSCDITWNSNAFTGNVKIDLVKGSTTTNLVASTVNDGSWTWTVTQSPAINYKIKISDAADGTPSDQSDFTFSVLKPSTNYYSSVSPSTGETLKTELFNLIDNHTALSYDAARLQMYGYIDNVSGQVQCVYTGTWVSVAQGVSPNSTLLNCEHTYCQSWFEGNAEATDCKSDLHHLYPTTPNSNSSRNNNPFGNVETVYTTWGTGNFTSYLGFNTDGYYVWESNTEHRGDLARAIFYFVTRYNETFIQDADDASHVTTVDAVDMLPTLLQWNLEDPVSQEEMNRNEKIYVLQNNRNPFIDHPEYVSAVWGGLVPSLTVTAPNTAVSLTLNSTYQITWSSQNFNGNVKISLYNNGVLSSVLAANTYNTGSYSWTVPASLAVGSTYKIKIEDSVIGYPSDFSDTNFSVISGSVAVPSNVQIAIVGNNVVISWTKVTNATSYIVEAANEPLTGFTNVSSGGTLLVNGNNVSWTAPVSAFRKFYRVRAVN